MSVGFAAVFAWLYRDPRREEVMHLPQPSPVDFASATSILDLLGQRKIWGGALEAGACNYCIFAPAVLHQPLAVLVCLTLTLSGISMASPVAWTLPSLLAPPGGVGRAGAIINLSGQVAAIAAPILTGYLGQRTHSFQAAFAIAGIIVFCGLLSYLFLLGEITPPSVDRSDGLTLRDSLA